MKHLGSQVFISWLKKFLQGKKGCILLVGDFNFGGGASVWGSLCNDKPGKFLPLLENAATNMPRKGTDEAEKAFDNALIQFINGSGMTTQVEKDLARRCCCSVLSPPDLEILLADMRSVSDMLATCEDLALRSKGYRVLRDEFLYRAWSDHKPICISIPDDPGQEALSKDLNHPQLPEERDGLPEVTSRLKLRLEQLGLEEKEVIGDGACQFRSLTDQLYGTEHDHGKVRSQVIQELKSHPDRYSGHVQGGLDDYITSMSLSDTWGDHTTLQAVANAYGTSIVIVSDFSGDEWFIIVEPGEGVDRSGDDPLCICFYAECHYNSTEVTKPALDKIKVKPAVKLSNLSEDSLRLFGNGGSLKDLFQDGPESDEEIPLHIFNRTAEPIYISDGEWQGPHTPSS